TAHPASPVVAADLAEARAAFYRGDYERCVEMTRSEVDRGIWNDYWSRLLMRALLTTGRYDEARQVYEKVATRFANSIPLRMLAAEAYRFHGDHAVGDRLLAEIPEMVEASPWRFS